MGLGEGRGFASQDPHDLPPPMDWASTLSSHLSTSVGSAPHAHRLYLPSHSVCEAPLKGIFAKPLCLQACGQNHRKKASQKGRRGWNEVSGFCLAVVRWGFRHLAGQPASCLLLLCQPRPEGHPCGVKDKGAHDPDVHNIIIYKHLSLLLGQHISN